MLKRLAGLTLVLLFGSVASWSGDVDFDQSIDIQEVINHVADTQAVPAPPVPVASDKAGSADKVKEWTIMVFINGKNNLADAAFNDIKEMEAIGSDSNINVLVEAGHLRQGGGYLPTLQVHNAAHQQTTPSGLIIPARQFLSVSLKTRLELPRHMDWTGVKRFYVIRNPSGSSVMHSLEVFANPSADMGDWRELVDFATWGKLNFPAKKIHAGGMESRKRTERHFFRRSDQKAYIRRRP
ncbi:MAG: hypothetical protein ABIG11_08865 [bacterium]